MRQKSKLRTEQMKNDRGEWELEAEVVRVQIKRSLGERIADAATIAVITTVSTVVATIAATMILGS